MSVHKLIRLTQRMREKGRKLVRFYSRNHQQRKQTSWTEKEVKCKDMTKPKWRKEKGEQKISERDGQYTVVWL